MANPLLREPLLAEHVKPRLLGHWGTTPGLTFVYAHLNRAISQRDQQMMYVIGPGHGGPGLVAAAYLEGTYSEVYSDVGPGEAGLRRLFTQFSFPGGIPSHVAPETPGSIHEGGELGYALSHAYGAAFDNPDLVVATVVGDGEAETGPLATSWHSNKFIDPRRDGAVLPILHLNGYKIANPTVLARIPESELIDLMRGYGYTPYIVDGSDPASMHQAFAATLDHCLDEIHDIQQEARAAGEVPAARRAWPMIVLRSPKGWTGPKEVDGKPMEGTWRAHQVPFADARTNDAHRTILEEWLRSYRPEELFDEAGNLVPSIGDLHPAGERRMSASPHANGGVLLRDLVMPDFRQYAVRVETPGTGAVEATRVLGGFLRDVMAANLDNFRLFSPDENSSNRLGDVMEVTDRTWNAEATPADDHLAVDGRIMEILSEHTCEGWLEGYLLTGRHGLFSCYEAFIHVIDSMFNQHAKWLKVTDDIPWRQPIASLNYLLTSHVWRQDHNGFSHQDPGFIDHVMNKKAEVVRVYLPPDANTLLSVADHCLRSRQYVNVIVAGKQPALQFLTMGEAVVHCTKGVGIWDWASTDAGGEPDVVMACAGDVPTLEALAAVDFLRNPRAGPEGAVRQRRGPDAAAARDRAPARALRCRLRRDLHRRQAGHLRLSRLPVADPPADLQADQPCQPACARLHRGGHDHDPVRHDGDEQAGPVQPGHGRHRPGPAAGLGQRLGAGAPEEQADRAQDLRALPRRGPPRGPRLALDPSGGLSPMRALVVYESMFGNTREVAEAVAAGLGDHLETTRCEVETAPASADGWDLIVAGGPTHAFSLSRPSTRADAVSKGADEGSVRVGLREWLDDLRPSTARQAFACFDTRVVAVRHLPGSAARKAARMAQSAGFRLLGRESFWVSATPGPLVDGDLERARMWGSSLGRTVASTDQGPESSGPSPLPEHPLG